MTTEIPYPAPTGNDAVDSKALHIYEQRLAAAFSEAANAEAPAVASKARPKLAACTPEAIKEFEATLVRQATEKPVQLHGLAAAEGSTPADRAADLLDRGGMLDASDFATLPADLQSQLTAGYQVAGEAGLVADEVIALHACAEAGIDQSTLDALIDQCNTHNVGVGDDPAVLAGIARSVGVDDATIERVLAVMK